ncbi:sigma-54-dependent transcriptional regulator [Undibacterium sp. Ji50W]|uniref:sigma-54-dependent transcriptional regulator n=1 Tax=Undibacterium sp. Ji50W TaxID=3413041 RepID=UPI003BF30ADC
MSMNDAASCPRILVVDDEAHLRELLEITLIKMGLDVDSAENLAVARQQLLKHSYALVLTDMRLPDGSGMELVQEVSTLYKNTPIAVITAFGSADNAVVALKAGAFDYVSKPVALDQLRKLVRSALQTNEVQKEQQAAPAKLASTFNSFLIGQSQSMREVRLQISRLARSMAPVIITGESGSGKELAAREIHTISARAGKPFVAVNCGAIPENLMEAEFFGYRKGAFTGAADDRDGFFQAASGGTLMLDEVADLPLPMQVKLLRAIQERRVRKVGATVEEAVDVRIISATHQNLAICVEEGRFRQDLYYRLNVIELHLPPLRERLEDIVELSSSILKKLTGADINMSSLAIDALISYDFPGNVRELENILERAIAFANDGCIEVADLALRGTRKLAEPFLLPAVDADVVVPSRPIMESGFPADVFTAPDLPCSLPEYLENVEREMIKRALNQTKNNRTQAAELLGVSFRQLRYQIQKLKIQE